MKRIVAAITIGLCLDFVAQAEPNAPLPVTAEQRDALGIVVGSVETRELVPRPYLPGRITLPNEKVRLITARSSGVLISPAVAVGDVIEAGQDLARLESPAFVSLQRDYLEALSQSDLARSTANRQQQLADEGIIAGRRATESTALLRDARSRLEERRQALELAGLDDEELATLRRTRRLRPTFVLRAPFAGVVLEQYARAGERLEAGGALYRIGDLAALMVEIHAPLDVARALDGGTRFALPDEGATGRVVTVGSEVHSLDQGVLVRGRVDEGPVQLRPGQFVRVRFETRREHGIVYAVPSTAVVHIDAKAWVFREVEGGFEPVAVDVVGGAGRESAVVGALNEGAAIATRGTAALKAHWLGMGGPS